MSRIILSRQKNSMTTLTGTLCSTNTSARLHPRLPLLTPDDAVSEWSGPVHAGAECDPSCESMPSTDVETLSAQPAASLATAPSDTKVTLPAGNGTRIRLRVGPPKITLRLRIPEGHRRTKVAERGTKRGKGQKAVSMPKKQDGRGRKKLFR